uniref:ATP synthase F0 subunit 8 n=1 Tax=Nyctiophylax orbicularis TaxID=2904907 RepID=A0A9E8LP33_9NEOP|nr:ATP synthase F0 subunit 8 [Nyctiophylax orbicularis]UZZ44198.1 ATP synthase F0 subunit 8 [Nyctiophylax orbicularis]
MIPQMYPSNWSMLMIMLMMIMFMYMNQSFFSMGKLTTQKYNQKKLTNKQICKKW